MKLGYSFFLVVGNGPNFLHVSNARSFRCKIRDFFVTSGNFLLDRIIFGHRLSKHGYTLTQERVAHLRHDVFIILLFLVSKSARFAINLMLYAWLEVFNAHLAEGC